MESIITKIPKRIEATPFVVKKAVDFTKSSSCFTKLCWYTKSAEKMESPIQ